MGDITVTTIEINDSKIVSKVETSHDLEKFIKCPNMFVEYDANIKSDSSVLNIPITATILPLAWLSGSDIHVDKIDKSFKESMNSLQEVFRNLYPLIPFKTNIIADKIIDNNIVLEDPTRQTALLFSGGVDSTYSLITHMDEKPRLIMHWGVERTPYPVYSDYWEKVYSIYSNFAAENDLSYNLTKTNVLEVLYPRKIEHSFYKELLFGSFWLRLQHSLVLLSLTAPLSMGRFNRLLIAASAHPSDPEINDIYRPHSQKPETDEKIKWANLQVSHDGYIERAMKTKAIAEYMKNNSLTLRVCMERKKAPTTLNCSDCPKCFRTITQLAIAEANPNTCGFNVDESTFYRIMKHITNKRKLGHFDSNTQKIIPEKINFDICGSKAYFEWLREYKSKKPKDVWLYKDLYNFLPYTLAKALDIFYKALDIDIHKDNPEIPRKKIESLKIEAIRPGWENLRLHQLKNENYKTKELLSENT